MVVRRKADDPLLSRRHWIHEAQSGLRLAGRERAVLVSLSHPDKRDHRSGL